MAYGADLEIMLEELELPTDSEAVGKTIDDSALRKRTGTTILAIKKGDGRVLTNPPVSTVLEATDRLILVGTAEQLEVATQMLLPEG
jgi:K+/H+ antiporter YhaU regulatory subunit KhtT